MAGIVPVDNKVIIILVDGIALSYVKSPTFSIEIVLIYLYIWYILILITEVETNSDSRPNNVYKFRLSTIINNYIIYLYRRTADTGELIGQSLNGKINGPKWSPGALSSIYCFLIAFRIVRSRITQQLFKNRICETAAAARRLRRHDYIIYECIASNKKRLWSVRKKMCRKHIIIIVLAVKSALKIRFASPKISPDGQSSIYTFYIAIMLCIAGFDNKQR